MVRLVLLGGAFVALAAAFAIPFVLATLRKKTGFAFGVTGAARVIASDVGIGPELILRDDELGLCGKPDYLLASGAEDRLVPFEVKPKRRSARLYDSDRIQIGAYLLALRATADDRASRVGYVRYQTGTFEVALTRDLEREIRQLIATMRRARQVAVVHRSHNSPARCRACSVRHHCDEALG
ncbi:MAG TPA: PD-(D/E)XK nuclease family protein [Gemmatimonadaceae bacterium]|nr:PD-(D/E)XK nuclease family protein [Gemmatimonadaceae bacterium]